MQAAALDLFEDDGQPPLAEMSEELKAGLRFLIEKYHEIRESYREVGKNMTELWQNYDSLRLSTLFQHYPTSFHVHWQETARATSSTMPPDSWSKRQ